MVVQLSSLRVAPELDAAKYVSGAAEKVAADRDMTASSNTTGAAVAQTDTKINAAGDTLSRFRRQYDQVYAAELKFKAGLNEVNRALETGRITIGEAQQLLVGMQQKLGVVGDASYLAAAGQVRLAAAVDAANTQLKEQALTAERVSHEVEQLRMAEATAAREAERMAAGVASLRAELNPLASAQDRVNAEIAEYVRWAEQGAISAQELAQAQALARGRLAANQNNPNVAALGAAAQFQDIAITAAMGQSIPTIALQQGTQLAGQLQMALGSQGAAGAAKLLGSALLSLASPVSLIAIGLTGLSAAAIQWFMSIRETGPSATEILKAHSEWLDHVLLGYDAARKAAKDYIEQTNKLPKGAVQSNMLTEQQKDLDAYKAKLAEVKNYQTAFLQGYINEYDSYAERDPALRQAAALQELQRQLDLTNPNFDDLVTKLTVISNTGADGMIRATAFAMMTAAQEAKTLADKIQSTGKSIEALNGPATQFEELRKAIDRVDSTKLKQQLNALYTQAIEGRLSIHGVSSALAGLAGLDFNLNGPISQFEALYAAAIKAKNAAEGLANTTAKTGRLGAMDAAAGQFDDAYTMWRRFGYDADAGIDPNNPSIDHSADLEAKRAEEKLRRQQEQLDRELEQLRTSLMTQEELENNSYATRLLDIQAFYEQGMIAKQEYDALLERAHIDHEDRMLEISRQRAEQDARIRDAMYSYAASTFGSLASAAESFGEKGLATAKAFGIAQALISTYAGIAKALDNPWPLNFVIAASVAAAGFAQVANIMSTRKGGGGSRSGSFGGGGSTGSTGSSAAPVQQVQALSLQIIGDVFPKQSVIELIQQINDAQKDGHKVDIHLKGA